MTLMASSDTPLATRDFFREELHAGFIQQTQRKSVLLSVLQRNLCALRFNLVMLMVCVGITVIRASE